MKNWEALALTAEQMASVDALAIEKYGVQLIQIMENAGRQLARLAVDQLGGRATGMQIFVLCGPGNNGGGGMVAARHLHNWGAEVIAILASDPGRLKEVPAAQWRTISSLGLASESDRLSQSSLIIDALLGYNGKGNPRPPISTWIDRANNSGVPILSLDLPSGLNATTGVPGNPTVKASATLTLALPKTGLFAPAAREFVGDLYLADIGIPFEVIRDLLPGFEDESLFVSNSVLRIFGNNKRRG